MGSLFALLGTSPCTDAYLVTVLHWPLAGFQLCTVWPAVHKGISIISRITLSLYLSCLAVRLVWRFSRLVGVMLALPQCVYQVVRVVVSVVENTCPLRTFRDCCSGLSLFNGAALANPRFY